MYFLSQYFHDRKRRHFFLLIEIVPTIYNPNPEYVMVPLSAYFGPQRQEVV